MSKPGDYSTENNRNRGFIVGYKKEWSPTLGELSVILD